MQRTYLAQRLNKPFVWEVAGKKVDNPFAFGSGLKNGGLSEEAMGLLREIFSFDYMGSAEFEWGAVPEALQAIAKDADQLRSRKISIPLKDVKPDFRDKPKGKAPEPQGEATVWVIARKDEIDEAITRILEMARLGYEYSTKESVNLDRALRPYSAMPDLYDRLGGWLELDNGYFFFIDEEMFTKTARLFGVDEP